MILNHFTDNDLYKFTTMNAIQKLYPEAMVRYSFIDRGQTEFPDGFARELQKEVDRFAEITLSKDEEQFLISRCYYFDRVFIDLLKGYRYDPGEVTIEQQGGSLKVEIVALISELFFIMAGNKPCDTEAKAAEKAVRLAEMKAEYSDFGTRRRFSFDVHDRVIKTLKNNSQEFFRGTSNVFLAMKHDLTPIGTHPHEWFMFHASRYGYRSANARALDAWVNIYKGDLGIALSDTFTSDNFFDCFSILHAKLFDGIRHDSGDPLEFTEKVIAFYKHKRIDPATKTIVFSDALNLDRISKIRKHVRGRIHDVYGIGTYLTNDVGVKPLNIVIKITGSKPDTGGDFHPVIKLSDEPEKQTGSPDEIKLCRAVLNL